MPSSGVWKIMKVEVWPVAHLADQLVVHGHFGDTTIRQAAHKAGAADTDVIDL